MTSRLPRENRSRRFGEKLGKMRDLGKGNILVLLDLEKVTFEIFQVDFYQNYSNYYQ